MKKSFFSYFSYLVLLLLAVGTLSSCGDSTDDPTAAPSITVTPETATVDVGESFTFAYTVSSDANLQEVRVIKADGTTAGDPITTFTDEKLYSGEYVFLGMATNAGSQVTFKIQATDDSGLSSTKEVTVIVNENPIATASFEAILLGAQSNTVGSFLETKIGAVYTVAEAKANAAKVDMAYLQGGATAGQGAVIGSLRDASVEQVFATNDGSWSTRSNTRFKNTSLSQADFNAIGISEGQKLIDAYTAGTQPEVANGNQSEGSASRVNQLTAGKVFAFQTADGKDGLAYVVSVDPGETGEIKLDIKVVK